MLAFYDRMELDRFNPVNPEQSLETGITVNPAHFGFVPNEVWDARGPEGDGAVEADLDPLSSDTIAIATAPLPEHRARLHTWGSEPHGGWDRVDPDLLPSDALAFLYGEETDEDKNGADITLNALDDAPATRRRSLGFHGASTSNPVVVNLTTGEERRLDGEEDEPAFGDDDDALDLEDVEHLLPSTTLRVLQRDGVKGIGLHRQLEAIDGIFLGDRNHSRRRYRTRHRNWKRQRTTSYHAGDRPQTIAGRPPRSRDQPQTDDP